MSAEYRQLLKEAVLEAKAKVNLLDYATKKLGIEMRGKSGTCPFCGTRGKFSINSEKGIAGCFRTGCGGKKALDHIGLYMEIKGVDFKEAARALMEYAGVEHPWDKIQREKGNR